MTKAQDKDDCKMKELFEHIKRVAIEDFKTFFEPFVWVWRAVRRCVSAVTRHLRLLFDRKRKGDE